MAKLARSPRLDSLARGNFEYVLCVLHFLKGEFDLALERLSVARELLAGTQYIALYGELLHGQVEFVNGRAQGALSHYRRARRIARKCFLLDPVAATSCEIAMKEITLECNRTSTTVELPGVPRALMNQGVPFSLFATASNVLIDTRLRSGHVDQALATADELLAYVRGAGLTTFVRLLAALRIGASDRPARRRRRTCLAAGGAAGGVCGLRGSGGAELEGNGGRIPSARASADCRQAV